MFFFLGQIRSADTRGSWNSPLLNRHPFLHLPSPHPYSHLLYHPPMINLVLSYQKKKSRLSPMTLKPKNTTKSAFSLLLASCSSPSPPAYHTLLDTQPGPLLFFCCCKPCAAHCACLAEVGGGQAARTCFPRLAGFDRNAHDIQVLRMIYCCIMTIKV